MSVVFVSSPHVFVGDLAQRPEATRKRARLPRGGNAVASYGVALSLLLELPERTESLLAGAAHALNISDPLLRQVCSSLEAPSAVAAVKEVFPNVAISFAEVPEPDPRVAWQPTPFVLWRYDGTTALPAIGNAPEPVTALVARIAARPYLLADWSLTAADVAPALDGICVEQIVAAMVHPPAAPAAVAPGDWRFRIQVATALIVSRTEEQRGRSSLEVLRHVVHGPVDWSTTAAIIAYLDVACRHPAQATLIAEQLLRLAARPPSPIWFSCGAYPAMLAVKDVRGLDASVYETVERTLRAWGAP